MIKYIYHHKSIVLMVPGSLRIYKPLKYENLLLVHAFLFHAEDAGAGAAGGGEAEGAYFSENGCVKLNLAQGGRAGHREIDCADCPLRQV